MAEGSSRSERIVLVLQGGGALGAYQAGAYDALAAAGQMPEWVAGVSIGAVNAALIAGNPPEKRVERLQEFWQRVSSSLMAEPFAKDVVSRKLFNEATAALVAAAGAPGFFEPKFPPAVFMPPGSLQAIGIYDTSPLHATLVDLVDFDLLNSGPVRCSVGAVQVSTGNLKYFDTEGGTIGPEHIMASGALPPGFPPVEIEGEDYWDGGIASNTPLQYVLDGRTPRTDTCIFQVDLFSARGPVPKTLFDVSQREKSIRYSSRTRLNTDLFREIQTIRRAVRRVGTNLPDSVKNSLDWKILNSFGCDAAITIVHLIHRRAAHATESSDYEFSRYAIEEHWKDGKEDVEQTFMNPAWKNRVRPKDGVAVLDLTSTTDATSTGREP